MSFHKLTPAVFGVLLTRWEEKYGQPLISAIFSFVDAAFVGLDKKELEEIIGLDDWTLEHTYAKLNLRPTLRHLPSNTFEQVWDEIKVIFQDCQEEGHQCIRFKEDHLAAVVREKYLSDVEIFFRIHAVLADYFSGKWSTGQLKEFNIEVKLDGDEKGDVKTGEASRNVKKQPLTLPDKATYGKIVKGVRYNTRRLKSEPYHLIASCQWEEVLDCYSQYLFLKYRIITAGVKAVVSDLEALPLEMAGRIVPIVHALNQSKDIIQLEPSQLASQLGGRMLPILGNNNHSTGLFHRILQSAIAEAPQDDLGVFPQSTCIVSNLGERTIENLTAHSKEVHATASSRQTSVICTAGNDKVVKVWDPKFSKPRKEINGAKDWIRTVAVSPNGKIIAWGGYDSLVTIYSLEKNKIIHELTGHNASITCLAFSPDGSTVVSGSDDATAICWNLNKNCEQRCQLTQHKGPIKSVFMQDNRHIFTGSVDGSAILWDVNTGDKWASFHGHKGPVSCVSSTVDGTYVFTGGEDGTVRMYRTPNSEATGIDKPDVLLRAHSQTVTGICHYGKRTKLILSCSMDSTIRLWDFIESVKLGSFTVGNSVTSLCITGNVCFFSCLNGIVGRLSVTANVDDIRDSGGDALYIQWQDGDSEQDDLIEMETASIFSRSASGESRPVSIASTKTATVKSTNSGKSLRSRPQSIVSISSLHSISADSVDSGLATQLTSLRALEDRIANVMKRTETVEVATNPRVDSLAKESKSDSQRQSVASDSQFGFGSSRDSQASLDNYGFPEPDEKSTKDDQSLEDDPVDLNIVSETIRRATLLRDEQKTKLGPKRADLINQEEETTLQESTFESMKIEELSAEEKQLAFERLVLGENPDVVDLEMASARMTPDAPREQKSKGCSCTIL